MQLPSINSTILNGTPMYGKYVYNDANNSWDIRLHYYDELFTYSVGNVIVTGDILNVFDKRWNGSRTYIWMKHHFSFDSDNIPRWFYWGPSTTTSDYSNWIDNVTGGSTGYDVKISLVKVIDPNFSPLKVQFNNTHFSLLLVKHWGYRRHGYLGDIPNWPSFSNWFDDMVNFFDSVYGGYNYNNTSWNDSQKAAAIWIPRTWRNLYRLPSQADSAWSQVTNSGRVMLDPSTGGPVNVSGGVNVTDSNKILSIVYNDASTYIFENLGSVGGIYYQDISILLVVSLDVGGAYKAFYVKPVGVDMITTVEHNDIGTYDTGFDVVAEFTSRSQVPYRKIADPPDSDNHRHIPLNVVTGSVGSSKTYRYCKVYRVEKSTGFHSPPANRYAELMSKLPYHPVAWMPKYKEVTY